MKKFLLLCLNIGFITPIAAARPILTKEKWEQMKNERDAQYGLQDQIMPETRPMLIEEPEDTDEGDQTPPPLPPRPVVQKPPLPPRPVVQKPELPPRPVAQQPVVSNATKSSLPFTSQELSNQAGNLKKPVVANVQKTPEPLDSFKEQLKAKFKGASGLEDEDETEEGEWED